MGFFGGGGDGGVFEEGGEGEVGFGDGVDSEELGFDSVEGTGLGGGDVGGGGVACVDAEKLEGGLVGEVRASSRGGGGRYCLLGSGLLGEGADLGAGDGAEGGREHGLGGGGGGVVECGVGVVGGEDGVDLERVGPSLWFISVISG